MCAAATRNWAPSYSSKTPKFASQRRVALAKIVSRTLSRFPGELEIIRRTSAVAACCPSASSRSRVSRATSVSWRAGAEPRRGIALAALRPLGFNAGRRRTFAGLPPALERLSSPATRMSTGVVVGHSNTGHETARGYSHPTRGSRAAARPAHPRQRVQPATANASSGLPGQFSPLLETEYLSDVPVAGLRALATQGDLRTDRCSAVPHERSTSTERYTPTDRRRPARMRPSRTTALRRISATDNSKSHGERKGGRVLPSAFSMVTASQLCYTSIRFVTSADRRKGYFGGKVTASRRGFNLSKCNSWQTQPRMLTEREVERLIEAAKQNRSGHRDATAILVAYRHGLRASEVVVLRWDDIDLTTGRLHVRRAKAAGMPVCIRYLHGKVGHCASSCGKRQHPHTSSSRNVAHRFLQPGISAWWPGRAWLRNSPFSFIPTCCGTPAGSSSPTTARHARHPGLSRPPLDHVHRPVHRFDGKSV